jgi:hypothetical protein
MSRTSMGGALFALDPGRGSGHTGQHRACPWGFRVPGRATQPPPGKRARVRCVWRKNLLTVSSRPVFSRPARVFLAADGALRVSCHELMAVVGAEALFFRSNTFILVCFSWLSPTKPWMELLAHSRACSSPAALFIVSFWELFPRQTFSHVGSSHGPLIGKRLVAILHPESEVGFCSVSSQKPLL